MRLFSSDQIKRHITNILHADTQLHSQRFDLSVKSIYHPVEIGSLDFGGSEFEPAGREQMRALKRNENDSYGWWNLQAGVYQAEFNEDILSHEILLGFISLHSHAEQAGIMGSSKVFTGDEAALSLNFQVPGCGCNIKENARLATVVFFGE